MPGTSGHTYDSHKKPSKPGHHPLFHRRGTEGPERLSNLPKVTPLCHTPRVVMLKSESIQLPHTALYTTRRRVWAITYLICQFTKPPRTLSCAAVGLHRPTSTLGLRRLACLQPRTGSAELAPEHGPGDSPTEPMASSCESWGSAPKAPPSLGGLFM